MILHRRLAPRREGVVGETVGFPTGARRGTVGSLLSTPTTCLC